MGFCAVSGLKIALKSIVTFCYDIKLHMMEACLLGLLQPFSFLRSAPPSRQCKRKYGDTEIVSKFA